MSDTYTAFVEGRAHGERTASMTRRERLLCLLAAVLLVELDLDPWGHL